MKLKRLWFGETKDLNLPGDCKDTPRGLSDCLLNASHAFRLSDGAV